MNNDLISRSALKEEFAKHEDRKGYLIGDWEDIIDNAPPIETTIDTLMSTLSVETLKATTWVKVDTPSGEAFVYKREETGHWIIDGHHYKCSRCGKTLAIMFSETDDDDLIGCPFCLADMRREGENESEKER